jgi:predicted dehydrogenase
VLVETDVMDLTRTARKCVEAGKHIHMDKPAGGTPAEFRQLLDRAKDQALVVQMGYMYRYNPEVKALLQRIRNGELGEIISVEAQMNCIQKDAVREWLGQLPGGQMFFLGCHLIDLIYRIQGAPKRITCLSPDNEYGFAVLEYEKGVSFAKTHAAERGGYARRQLVVIGSKKTVELKPLEWYVPDGNGLLYTTRTERVTDGWHEWGTESKSELFDRCDGMMASFAAMVRGEKKNPYTLDYELTLYKAVLAACGQE